MNQEQIIKAVYDADIDQDDWYVDIVEQVDSQYAKGYINATIESMNGRYDYKDESFREELLEVLEYDI